LLAAALLALLAAALLTLLTATLLAALLALLTATLLALLAAALLAALLALLAALLIVHFGVVCHGRCFLLESANALLRNSAGHHIGAPFARERDLFYCTVGHIRREHRALYPIRWIYQARMRTVANQSAIAPIAVAAPLKKA
jgi:hypothetical protein